MLGVLLFGNGLLFAASAIELAIEYKTCVETFAMDQVRSGETAEVLVEAGEAACTDRLSVMEDAYRQEVSREVSQYPDVGRLRRSDVQHVIDQSVERRVAGARAQIRAAALRNVVQFKAKLNALDAANVPQQ